MTKKEEFEKIAACANRACTLKLYDWSHQPRVTALMDIEAATRKFPGMDLDVLFGFSNEDFIHDIVGIENAIDRSCRDSWFDDTFLPRCVRG